MPRPKTKDHRPKQIIIFIVGPTAVGKTEIAAHLVKKLSAIRQRIVEDGGPAKNFGGNAEIISCDSMQLYKGMDIISSKPAKTLRKKIPHHLIDVIAVQKEYNVAVYRRQALRKIKEILRKGKIPLFVGGTGHYMTVLLDGIFKGASRNARLRKKLYRQAAKLGSQYLYEKLKKIDPEAAGKIHSNDTKRIIRAIEVFELTGKPISQLQKQRKGLADDYAVKIFCLDMQRSKLYQKIEARVEKMFNEGLLNEVRKLLSLKLSKTASCAIGLKELKGYFDGTYDLAQAKYLIKRNTRHYAKRQLTWFRKDKRIRWIKVRDKEKPATIANKILKEINFASDLLACCPPKFCGGLMHAHKSFRKIYYNKIKF